MSATAIPNNTSLLKVDGKNRAWRTFIQQFAYDLVAALAVWVVPLVGDFETWDDFEWAFISLMFFKTLVVTAFSYVMRVYLDKSVVPTPVPPAPVAEPADRTGFGVEDLM